MEGAAPENELYYLLRGPSFYSQVELVFWVSLLFRETVYMFELWRVMLLLTWVINVRVLASSSLGIIPHVEWLTYTEILF